ncbi:MAG TPA: orotidine 5'-phosphate decarboxylase, partial [Taishania sp.]|nr:orotidine 5'-phosphate decarboxylase [Taishania sp.]
RGIIYASNGLDFAQKAAESAQQMQAEMRQILLQKGFI